MASSESTPEDPGKQAEDAPARTSTATRAGGRKRTTRQSEPAAATPRRDLTKLAAPFPGGFIERTPSGGNRRGEAYVAHHVVNQWLLGILGPFDFQLVEIIRGDVPATPGDPHARSERFRLGTPGLHGVVVGAVYRLTVEIDGRRTVIEEAGDVEDPHNWKHDGARLKQAASDALKRCAMRIGLGLHLWAQEHYVLDQRLAAGHDPAPAERERRPTPVARAS